MADRAFSQFMSALCARLRQLRPRKVSGAVQDPESTVEDSRAQRSPSHEVIRQSAATAVDLAALEAVPVTQTARTSRPAPPVRSALQRLPSRAPPPRYGPTLIEDASVCTQAVAA
jgi:hypothetical protein